MCLFISSTTPSWQPQRTVKVRFSAIFAPSLLVSWSSPLSTMAIKDLQVWVCDDASLLRYAKNSVFGEFANWHFSFPMYKFTINSESIPLFYGTYSVFEHISVLHVLHLSCIKTDHNHDPHRSIVVILLSARKNIAYFQRTPDFSGMVPETWDWRVRFSSLRCPSPLVCAYAVCSLFLMPNCSYQAVPRQSARTLTS